MDRRRFIQMAGSASLLGTTVATDHADGLDPATSHGEEIRVFAGSCG